MEKLDLIKAFKCDDNISKAWKDIIKAFEDASKHEQGKKKLLTARQMLAKC